MRWRFAGQQGLVIVLLAVLGLFLIWPILLTVRGGFIGPDGSFSLEAIQLVFLDPALRAGLINSALIAVATTTRVSAARAHWRGQGQEPQTLRRRPWL